MISNYSISVKYYTYEDDAFLQLLDTDLNSENNLVCNNGAVQIIIYSNVDNDIVFMFEFQLIELVPDTKDITKLLEPFWFNYNNLDEWNIKIKHYYEFIITANKRSIKLELINPDTKLIKTEVEIERKNILLNKFKEIYQKNVFYDNC